MEAPRSSETSVLTRVHVVASQETDFFKSCDLFSDRGILDQARSWIDFHKFQIHNSQNKSLEQESTFSYPPFAASAVFLRTA
jgi:hypothetical protein